MKSFSICCPARVTVFHGPFHTLIAQQGEEVREQERLTPVQIIMTSKKETVIDFGQNLTGYVEISIDAKVGEEIVISHAEVLDSVSSEEMISFLPSQ